MDELQKAANFQQEFAELINRSVQTGVPLPNIILACGNTEFELRLLMRQVMAQEQAKANASKIVPANGIHLPPGRG